MAIVTDRDALIADLDRVAQQTLAWFAGPGRTNQGRVDRWGARDVLMHFLYFHNATAWGIQSVAQGGPPWPLPTDADTINEVCRRLHEGESADDLLTQLRLAHARLMRAARNSPDLDQGCFKRPNGELVSVRQRLTVLAKHWAEHVRELNDAVTKT